LGSQFRSFSEEGPPTIIMPPYESRIVARQSSVIETTQFPSNSFRRVMKMSGTMKRKIWWNEHLGKCKV